MASLPRVEKSRAVTANISLVHTPLRTTCCKPCMSPMPAAADMRPLQHRYQQSAEVSSPPRAAAAASPPHVEAQPVARVVPRNAACVGDGQQPAGARAKHAALLSLAASCRRAGVVGRPAAAEQAPLSANRPAGLVSDTSRLRAITASKDSGSALVRLF